MEQSSLYLRNFAPARLISIPGQVSDLGQLHFWEDSTVFHQGICRCFWITQVSPGEFRGKHAHWEEAQVLVCLSGISRVSVEGLDGRLDEFLLDSPGKGLFVPPLNWVKVSFEPSSVLLGLSDRAFSEQDYIRDFQVFRSLQFRFHEPQ